MWRAVEGGEKERRGQVQLSTLLYFLLRLNILPRGHPDLEDGGHVRPQDSPPGLPGKYIIVQQVGSQHSRVQTKKPGYVMV